MTTRPFLRTAALAAAGAAALLGVSACGSGSSQAAPAGTAARSTSTATSTTTDTTVPSGAAGLPSQADALCAEASTVRSDVSGLDLKSPSSVGSAAGTVTTDLAKLQAALASVTNAGSSGARSGPLQTLTGDVRQALTAGQQTIGQVSQGKIAAAQGDVQQAISDLQAATAAGKQAGLTCGAPAPGSPSTTTGG